MKLQRHPVIARESVRFIAERDSSTPRCSAPTPRPGTPEFDLFVKEVAREMTVEGGAEMHRHPPRLGARRTSSTRSRPR